MSREIIDKIIGEALVNTRFRAILLSNPGKVAGLFDLSPREQELFSNLRAGSLEEFASQLYNEMRKRSEIMRPHGTEHLWVKKCRKAHCACASGPEEV